MREFKKLKYSWKDMNNLLMGDIKSSIFETAIKLRIFDELKEAVKVEEIAEKLGFHKRNTELLLNALAGLDLIKKEESYFINTEKTSLFLESSSENYIGDFLIHFKMWHSNVKKDMEMLVRKGPSKREEIVDSLLWAESAKISAAYQYSGPAQMIAELISGEEEFKNMRKMLDLGGGAGFFAQALVGAHPVMNAVIFEQPQVTKVAFDFAQESKMEHRIEVIEGNYLRDDLGCNYDLVFASSTLNFAKDSISDLFAKIKDAMSEGGLFVVFQDGIHSERTKPIEHIMEFLAMEFYGEDVAIEKGFLAKEMLKVGFRSVHSFTVDTEFGEMDIDIARK